MHGRTRKLGHPRSAGKIEQSETIHPYTVGNGGARTATGTAPHDAASAQSWTPPVAAETSEIPPPPPHSLFRLQSR